MKDIHKELLQEVFKGIIIAFVSVLVSMFFEGK